MPAALTPAEPVKTWWPLSKPPSTKDLRQKHDQLQAKVSKFNSFASAIGFKSKRPPAPTLAIQDPPSYLDRGPSIPFPNPISPISSRPSKAPSSTRSRVDSLEPRTPNDFLRDRRQSLLTLSDTDPFAGRPMVLPNLPSDPNRLSAYSNSSNDLPQRKADAPPFNRVSYASSSSNSNYHSPDFPPVPIVAPGKAPEVRQLHNKRSMGSLQIKRPDPLFRQTSMTTPHTNSVNSTGSSSASTLATTSRSTQPDNGPPRPKMRARGMTDSGGLTRAGFFIEGQPPARKQSQKANSPVFPPSSPEMSNSPGPSTPLRVVVRQASSSRLQTPPSAPPTHSLPSPPQLHLQGIKKQQSENKAKTSSSSRMSSSSAISLTNDMFAYPPFDKRASGKKKESKTASSAPRTLKKVSSQQSLSRRNQAAHPLHPKHLPILLTEFFASSVAFITLVYLFLLFLYLFVHPLLRGLQISLCHQRRFWELTIDRATTWEPSTAQPTSSTIEDDKLSLFSLRSDNDSHFLPYKPWSTSTNQPASPSFWDEADVPRSPVRSIPDYTPQAIISKAELARLDLDTSDTSPQPSTRTRGFSVLSTSTVASSHLSGDQDSEVVHLGLSPPPPGSRQSGSHQSLRMSTSSFAGKPSGSIPQGGPANSALSSRNDHDDSRLMRPKSSPISQETAGPLSHASISLPPPPRRHRPVVQQVDKPSSSCATTVQKSSSVKSNSVRSVSAMEKAMHRRSIMKKPSFLEFDADTDEEADNDPGVPRVTGSFLDLARESFETMRSGE
ncbi:hypothetical protein CPB84DRAFT_1841499 [Gymnopilus junonius]|uniref:Uncharacterized protein n=1 Tax=Gymnopilus junonius TaxID=109634 RepID=A0A9P5P0V9_GYMJU|nr:hypothetical protein CPB84DRAFT_1841499 [Gymnopilus junonius]